MSTMSAVTDVLSAVGAGDAAISAMGPGLTIVFAYIAGIGVAQGAKFPLWIIVKDPWHSYVVRMVGVMSAFSFAHYLSSHLSVPMEMFVGVTQPIIYTALQGAAERWAPWLAKALFRGVNKDASDP